MRILLPVFAGIAVVVGVVSGTLWHELRAERQENESLRAQLADSRIRRQPVLPVSAGPAASDPQVTIPAAPAPAPESPAARDADQQARAAAALRNRLSLLATSLGIASSQELMKDPEFRKARLVELRIQNARTYPGVARELGLSEKEANQLFELLAENQLKMADELVTRNADPGTTTTALQQRTARQEEQEGSIRAMLGGKYSQWQDYQQSLPARYQVFSMGSTLAAAGVPLTDSQAKALTGVMIADQQQQKLQPSPPIAQSFNPADPRPRGEQILEESQRRAEETNRRTLDAVAPNLSAKQLATLKELFEQENNARRDTLSRLPRPQAAPQRP